MTASRALLVFVAFAFAASATAAAAAPAAAQETVVSGYNYENLTFRGVGFSYGRIWPSKVDPAASYTLRADLGYFGPAVRIIPHVSYWSSELRRRELQELADRIEALPPLQIAGVDLTADDLGPIRWSDLALGVDAQIVWTAPMSILTYVGGGFAIHALNGRGNAVANTFVEDLLDSTTPGFALMAGLEIQPLARMRVFGEARYNTLSDIRYPELRIGGALMFPAHDATQEER